ncbi:MAG TPA: HEPN domain-containing protein [Candidatus Acidoferrales bacterium]|nr:HEPN domain-containing protein [Candidatus Acidoferrales bacterium]
MHDPIQGLIQNIAEVRRLLEIHEQVGGTTRGRKHNLEVLNKSGIVLLVACWEAFVEDLASAAFDAMLVHASAPTIFPAAVLTCASSDLKSSQDNREVWKLAGDGWRAVLQAHKAEVLKDYVGKLNTPKPKQVDILFSTLVGLSSMSQGWHWKRMSPNAAVDKLNRLVELRGSIAHRVAAAESVHKTTVRDHLEFISRLSVKSSNRTRAFLYARTKQQPWPPYHFRGVS